MASPERLRTHPIKRSVKRVSFGTISSAEYIPYGCFQKVVQSLLRVLLTLLGRSLLSVMDESFQLPLLPFPAGIAFIH